MKCLLCARSPGLSQPWDMQQIIQLMMSALIFWALGWVLETAHRGSHFPGEKTKTQRRKPL